MQEFSNLKTQDFAAIRLKLASPDAIHDWSHGEVLRPETINYRTQKPERDGLFCERIFGPSKDWECYCGKYKRIRYKGIVCDKCGVEVTRSVVRRERMGHIDLSAPVSHIWFLRGVPSKIGLILDMSVQALEKVVYFANFIITDVDENLRQEMLVQIDEEANEKRKNIRAEHQRLVKEMEDRKHKALAQAKSPTDKKNVTEDLEQEMINAAVMRDEQIKDLQAAVDIAKKELIDLEPMRVISESTFEDLSMKYGHVFEAGIGADAIHLLLKRIDLDVMITNLDKEIEESTKNQRRRLTRRLKFTHNLKKNGIRPEWMIMTTIPVIPPDLRPMVQLDGGRFAASDLNDLYRRVINRNNRLKRLQELKAPEVIQRNEKRMLQEAVDALFDNSARHGKTVTASTGQKRQLKSLADILKGKQGRFRQNLLGKRVDYSGRSVIVVGPHLQLHQCGLPKTMALELFKPFVISQLIKREVVFNVRSANRFVEAGSSVVWDILEEITKDAYVLLNRAPTLHRLGIQAFQPVLIEGKAIQVHPLVCSAFNADFDGDQMAVHVPLTEEARWEAENIMLSSKNLLKPATGEPVVSPAQDLVLGSYYMTLFRPDDERKISYATPEEVLQAYELRNIGIQTKIRVRMDGKMVETNAGRILFNQILPDDMRFVNTNLDKKALKKIVSKCFYTHGRERTVQLLDDLKDLTFEYVTRSGLSWGMRDLLVPVEKGGIMKQAVKEVDEIKSQYDTGLLTDDERHARIVAVWTKAKDEVTKYVQSSLNPNGPVFTVIDSGSRGSWGQTTQMIGMKGLVTNPSGETIELPVTASFKEGLGVLEYFISTHGARKGLSDTALRTANAGYLTRRLVDVSQDMVITVPDCGEKEGVAWDANELKEIDQSLEDLILGRVLTKAIVQPKSGKVLVAAGELVTENHLKTLEKIELTECSVRSILTCKALQGCCAACYGYDLGHNRLVEMGTAVGIIAAQSIGEPGTQLTMRTFHTGGVAGSDITQGLPRVEELFEARPLKVAAIISDIDGKVVDIIEEGRQQIVKIQYVKPLKQMLKVDKHLKLKVKDGDAVVEGALLAVKKEEEILAKFSGSVKITDNQLVITGQGEHVQDYPVHVGFGVLVKKGDLITKGQQISEGNLDLHQLYQFRGKLEVQKYLIKEIQYIYSSQGQNLNSKHVEIIARQMFARYFIKDSRSTDLITGDIVSALQLARSNKKAKEEGGQTALVESLLLGITKASLSTDSFLSAASFMETAKILIDAAVSGKVDTLVGLKENVIIGKLIPVGTGFKDKNQKSQTTSAAQE